MPPQRRPRPDIEHTREALRQHDERVTEDDEEREREAEREADDEAAEDDESD